MRFNRQRTLTTILAAAGLAAPATADLFSFDTSLSTPHSITINGVEVRYTTEGSYAYLRVLGDLNLHAGDAIRFTGDRVVIITVLNNMTMALNARIDAGAEGMIGGPGGGRGGNPAGLPGGVGGGGGLGGLGGTWGAGGVGGTLGFGGTNGFPGVTGTIGFSGNATTTQASTGSPGSDGFGSSGGAPGHTAFHISDLGGAYGERGAGIAGGAGGAAGGGNGSPGRIGNNGGPGATGLPGQVGGHGGHGSYTADQSSAFTLITGGGGGGGASGTHGTGGGGGGGAGGGSGGGGGGSGGFLGGIGGYGGGGSSGTNGGRGGDGGLAGLGSAGGGGGGAIEIRVLGRTLINGSMDARGSNTLARPSPGAGQPGHTGQVANAPGDGSSGTGSAGAGGRGGRGGIGGAGGTGGAGGAGGYGGGGAGGTIILQSSVFSPGFGWLDVRGGGGGTSFASPGRITVRDNIAGDMRPVNLAGNSPSIFPAGLASTSFNTHAWTQTPMIPDLIDGAEVYGLADLDATDFADTLAHAPAGAELALIRLDVGPAPFHHDFIGHDFIAVINLSDGPIPGVRMSVQQTPVTTLQTWGTVRRANNQSSQPLAGLAPGEVWITLVPSSTSQFRFGTASTLVTGNPGVGEALYITGAVCDADLNDDGTLNFFDISQFLTMYNQLDAGADMNDDGLFNFFDIAAYITLYNSGCP